MEPNSEVVVVEIECLRGIDSKLVIRELAVAHRDCVECYQFLPPQQKEPPEARIHNSWIKRNLNGLSWSMGYIPYEYLPIILRRISRRFDKIYIKGLEKKTMLSNILGSSNQIIDLDSISAPKYKDLKQELSAKCVFHFGNNKQCALDKSLKFYMWLLRKKIEESTTAPEAMDEENWH